VGGGGASEVIAGGEVEGEATSRRMRGTYCGACQQRWESALDAAEE